MLWNWPQSRADESFTSSEIFSLFVAGLCHDLDHPGTTNAYEIATVSELALRYNDRSVLESHHAAVAFRILCGPKSNILQYFPPSVMRKFRKNVVACILATDMATHGEVFHYIFPCLCVEMCCIFVESPFRRSPCRGSRRDAAAGPRRADAGAANGPHRPYLWPW